MCFVTYLLFPRGDGHGTRAHREFCTAALYARGRVSNYQINALKCRIVWLAARRIKIFEARGKDPAAAGNVSVPPKDDDMFRRNVQTMYTMAQHDPSPLEDPPLWRDFLTDLASTINPSKITGILADPVWRPLKVRPGDDDVDALPCPSWLGATDWPPGDDATIETADDFCPTCRQEVVARGLDLDQHFQSTFGKPRRPYEYLDMAHLDDFLEAQ